MLNCKQRRTKALAGVAVKAEFGKLSSEFGTIMFRPQLDPTYIPVKPGNEVIGAVGIGGAPGGNLDEQCAVVALDKVKELLK